ncbi:MAG: ABC transporter substrate-binding protein [Chloroflexi bacterium]|nr:ABC transporter substrate-binding protein [Chloroflexota bacterium]
MRVDMRRRYAVPLGLALAASMVAVGCAPSSQPASQAPASGAQESSATQTQLPPGVTKGKPGGTLRIMTTSDADPLGFDPFATFTYRTHNALGFTHSSLIGIPVPGDGFADYTPVPNLAEKWEWNDPKTLTVTLKKGIKWHNKPPVNGRELTSEDVKWTYERELNSSFTYRSLLESVASLETPDRYTIKFKLSDPNVDFLLNLSHQYQWILAKDAGDFGKDAKWGDFKDVKTVIGTGPFMLERWQPNQGLHFVKNPDYFKPGLPYVDRVEYIAVPDIATQLAALKADQVDIGPVLAPNVKTVTEGNPKLVVQKYQGTCGGQLFQFRVDKPPFSDMRVRRALSLSIDREGYLKAFYNGEGDPMNGPIFRACHPDEWKLKPGQLGPGDEWFKYDPAKAKKLLGEAGFPSGIDAGELLSTDGYGVTVVNQAEWLKATIETGGFKSRIVLKPYAEWLTTGHAGLYDNIAFGAATAYTAIDEWTYGMLHSASAANKCHCNDAELDKLLEQQRLELNWEKRREILRQIQRLAADRIYYLWMPAGMSYQLHQPFLKNVFPKGLYQTGLRYEQTWIDK